MKVAIIGSRGYPYVYSGYETFIKELVERLVPMGVSVRVYCHANLFGNRPKMVNGVELKYFRTIETKSLSQLIHSFQSMIHACLSKDIDIILVVNSANGPFGIISRFFRKKTAINVDGLEWLRPKWKGLGSKYFYWASKLATRYYDQIINDSEAMRDFYLKEFKCDSEVIAYGANIRKSNNGTLIKNWGLNPEDYYLIVGRLIPDNNSDIIIEEFCKSNSTKMLVIVGDVPYKDKYVEKIKSVKDSRIIFTGYITDQNILAELYHNSYAYIHGHEFGGTNPTMLKALAYGCAILALDTIFTKEMLNGNKHGLFFTKQKDNIKSIIEFADSNPALLAELRSKSRERIIENYTWQKIADQYLELFKKLINNY
jgi:glycosyltransferase involved in cell wall biosynthesis